MASLERKLSLASAWHLENMALSNTRVSARAIILKSILVYLKSNNVITDEEYEMAHHWLRFYAELGGHITTTILPGVTGEQNKYSLRPKGICLISVAPGESFFCGFALVSMAVLFGNPVLATESNDGPLAMLFQLLERDEESWLRLIHADDIDTIFLTAELAMVALVCNETFRMKCQNSVAQRTGSLVRFLGFSNMAELERQGSEDFIWHWVCEHTETINLTAATGDVSLLSRETG